MKGNKRVFILPIVLFLLFCLFTAAVIFVDKQPIGPENSVVGLAGINGFFKNAVGSHMLWYDITGVIGKAAFLVVAFFAVLGLGQCIARKSIKQVNADILLMALLYVLIAVFYIFFEKCIINYRPMILEEGLEASYPSSHTMLVFSVMGSAVIWIRNNVKKRAPKIALNCLLSLCIAVTVAGRLLSGVHWFTDIVGGILLSVSLLTLYSAAVKYCS